MNAVTTLQESRPLATSTDLQPTRAVGAATSMFNDPDKFAHAQRVANVFANSQLVPAHMRGKLPDCLIALNLADRLNEDPLTVMQNIVVVHGSPGWKATYLIARANVSGRLHGPIRWRHEGIPGKAGYVCTAYADLADPRLSQDERRIEASVTWEMAEAEGWTKNAKYKSMPQVMMQYRAATFLVRLYLSDIMLGIQSTDVELETQQDETGTYQIVGTVPAAPPARPSRRQQAPDAQNEEVVDQTTGEITPAVPMPPPRQRGSTVERAVADRIVDDRGTVLKDKNPEALGTTGATGHAAEGEGSGVQPSAAADDFPGDRPMPASSEPDLDAMVERFEEAAANAGTMDELDDAASDLQPYVNGDKSHLMGRALRTRAEDAYEDNRKRIVGASATKQKPDGVDPNDPDYRKGWSDKEKGLSKCITSAIRDNPERLAKWQAGFDACGAQQEG